MPSSVVQRIGQGRHLLGFLGSACKQCQLPIHQLALHATDICGLSMLWHTTIVITVCIIVDVLYYYCCQCHM